MHLLQSGVDLTVSALAGPRSTRHGYVEIDLEMKRKALATCAPPGEPADGLQRVMDSNRDVIRWLESL
jgi:hypothetical protein